MWVRATMSAMLMPQNTAGEEEGGGGGHVGKGYYVHVTTTKYGRGKGGRGGARGMGKGGINIQTRVAISMPMSLPQNTGRMNGRKGDGEGG